MKVIAVANQKGGMGKTTTAIAMASTLQNRGYKTLLVDTDVQCNSTDTYQAKTENTPTLYDLILDDEPCTPEEAVQHTPCGDIIASDPLLSKTDDILNEKQGAVYRLREAIRKLTEYDYIIIDTNPAVNTMLFNALTAADEVLIPITADRYAVKGLAQLTDTIDNVKSITNPSIRIAGLLLVRFNERTNLNKDVKNSLTDLAKSLGSRLFTTYIRESVKCREAQVEQMTMLQYAPHCTTQTDYESFIDEYLQEESNGKA